MLRSLTIGLLATCAAVMGCDRPSTGTAAKQTMVDNAVAAPVQTAAPAGAPLDPAAPSPTPIPYPNTNTTERDVSTGQATGKRSHKPIAFTQ